MKIRKYIFITQTICWILVIRLSIILENPRCITLWLYIILLLSYVITGVIHCNNKEGHY